MEFNNMNQNEKQNLEGITEDSIDNYTGMNNVNLDPNPNVVKNEKNDLNLNQKKMQKEPSLGKSEPKVNIPKEFGNPKKTLGLLGIITFLIAIFALALSGFSTFKILENEKKLDKLNAEINKVRTGFNNRINESEKKLEELESLKKEMEKSKKTEIEEDDKSKYSTIAENVLKRVGIEYKKDQKQFINEEGILDQKKFEKKFLEDKDILKMNKNGKWTTKTEGATIRFVFEFKDEKDKKNNFYADLMLKEKGEYEVKVINGELKTEKEADITNKINGENND